MAEAKRVDNFMALVLGPAWLVEIKSSNMKVFTTLELLLKYASEAADHGFLFRLFIPSQYLETLLEQKIYDSSQVDSITAYYNSPRDLAVHAEQYRNVSSKLHFRATAELQTCLNEYLNVRSSPLATKPTRSKRKKHAKTKKFTITTTINPDILCSKCKQIFDQPFQLVCGHRQCKSCIDKQQGSTVKCSECQEETLRDKVWLDRGFANEIQRFKETSLYDDL